MPVVEITNRTLYPVSTSIGTVRAGRGYQISVPIDLVTKKLVEELEQFRGKNHIDFRVINDPDIRDDIEQGPIGFPTAVDDILLFVDNVQGTDKNAGTSANAPYKTLQKALNTIPKNVNNFSVYIFLAEGNYSGIVKGITTANNDNDPIEDPLDEPYSFLYSSTRNGVVRIIGTTEGELIGTVSGATFGSLQDTATGYVPDEHIGKLVRVLTGPAYGEIGLIKGNTADELEVDFFFNVPEPGDQYEIMNRTTNIDLEAVNCAGLVLVDRCNLTGLSTKFTSDFGLVNCKGPIVSQNSKINAVYHFMNSNDYTELYASICDVGYGSYFHGVERQNAEFFSVYSLMNVKALQCGTAGTHIGTQDYRDGYSIFGRHSSQVNLYEVNVDDCLGSFVVLVSSHGWIGFSDIGLTVPLPNHILEGYLNSTYNDAGGNVFNSVDDNIKLETGSASVDSTGGGDSSGGVKIFPDEATLLAAVEDNGTIAFAELESKYYLRSFDTWFEHFAPPQPAGDLVGQALSVSGTTPYSARIPSGLGAEWSALTPGSLITNMIVDPTFTLTSPDQSNRFRAGTVSGGQASAGALDLLINGAVSESYDIAANGVGVIGSIEVTALVNHNAVFQRANARFLMTLVTEGRNAISMQHSEAGVTNESEYYYDDVNAAPFFATQLNLVESALVPKYLSGIEAADIGSTYAATYQSGVGIYQKTYHPTAVGSISGTGFSSSNDNPVTVPAVGDQLTVNRPIAVDQANVASLTAQVIATLRKPTGAQGTSAAFIGRPINTYGIVSTGKDDRFFDEARRIVLDSGTGSGDATPFNSSISLVNGNAQQRHNGTLQYPDSGDYPGFSGDQEYQRFIDKASASTGALTFQGISFSDINPYGTGDLNVLIELAVQGKFFDLGRPVGSDNGSGSGADRANSIGARNDGLSSGGVLAWSVGTDSTAFNNNEYRLIVIFRNNTHSITRITEA